jgi:hypothetical protein
MSTFLASPPRRPQAENTSQTAIHRKRLSPRRAEAPLVTASVPEGTEAARRSGQEEIRLGKGKTKLFAPPFLPSE